jgi:hypothetical protein
MTNKAFDCVAMMHRAADHIYEETTGMTRKEESPYWQRKQEQAGQPADAERQAPQVREDRTDYRPGR